MPVAKKGQRGDTGAPKLQKMTMGNALKSMLKQKGGRSDIEFKDAPNAHLGLMEDIPLTERAGYPLTRPPGSVDPADWRCNDGKEVFVDFTRHVWLPDDWGQGVKFTNPTSHSTGTSGGTYTVIIAPDGKVFYHRGPASEYAGKPFDKEAGFNGQMRQARLKANQTVQLVRRQIRDISGPGGKIGTDSDKSFFAVLSKKERSLVADTSVFHFAVVSARRATKPQGVQDIFAVQSQCVDCGITPTWYVDAESLEDYRKLGLDAVVGGKLTPSRNKALEDAHKKGKVCVQLSDDITAWEYRAGPRAADRTDDAVNKAHADAKRFILTPLAAARFILAKMRGAAEGGDDSKRPHLGGVYMLGSCARAFGSDEFQRNHFILGDFFVADVAKKLTVKFDENLSLKEDYDFACSHIRAHGSVMRCNRLTLSVKHYSNEGGAVTVRDGKTERRNIAILLSKWPRGFWMNPKRKNEVIMRWPKDDDAEGRYHAIKKKKNAPSLEEDGDKEDAEKAGANDGDIEHGGTPGKITARTRGVKTPALGPKKRAAGANQNDTKQKRPVVKAKSAMKTRVAKTVKAAKAAKTVKAAKAAKAARGKR